MIALLAALACADPPCVPLDRVPVSDPQHLHDDLDVLREQLVTAGSWFQVEPCVAEVVVHADVNDQVESEHNLRGYYDPRLAMIHLEPQVGQSTVTHELCHTLDHDLQDDDGWWLSDQHFDAFDQVTLAGCTACVSFDGRINETFAQYCDDGPQPVQLGDAGATACPQHPGPLDVDWLIADRVFAEDDGLDPPVVLSDAFPAGVLVQPTHGIDGFHLARVGSGGFFAIISLLPDPTPDVDLPHGAWQRRMSDRAAPQYLARVDPRTGQTAPTRPWAWLDEVQQVHLSGGEPLVAWGLDVDGRVRHAWAVQPDSSVQALRGVGGLSFADAVGMDDRLVLARQDDAGVALHWFDLETGLETPLELDDDLLAGATLVSLRGRAEGGALLAVTRRRFGQALWLDAAGQVVRREAFPGAWTPQEVLELGEGLALRWTIERAGWTEGVTDAMSGYATWQPGQPWQVTVPGCDARMWALGVLDGELVGEWRSYDEEDWPRWVAVLPWSP